MIKNDFFFLIEQNEKINTGDINKIIIIYVE